MADQNAQDALTSQFCAVTGEPPERALQYLQMANGDVEAAISTYYLEQEDSAQPGAAAAETQVQPDPTYTGPRFLDGRPAPASASAGASKAGSSGKKTAKRTGLATLGSIGGSDDGHGHNHDDNDDDDDDDDDDERRGPRSYFTGGEKSGLAVQDPTQRSKNSEKLIKSIIDKATSVAQNAAASRDAAAPRPTRFTGSGQTLGGDGVESRVIPGPSAGSAQGARMGSRSRDEEAVSPRHIIHLWSDGISVDDGPLHRFGDAETEQALAQINAGQIPRNLLNMTSAEEMGEHELGLARHPDNWRQLPRIYRPFGGQGHRLGSPVPGDLGAAAAPAPAAAPPASILSTGAGSGRAITASTNVDETQPTLMLRILLPDGTRLPARFNASHTVGDVYSFVAHSGIGNSRPWVVATTFPNKEHTDKSLVLGDMAEFKKGGAVMVKWV